ncbi:defense Hdd11 [Brachionus plicatilis]|uniref:Defense Hdd11 n=1 Tax=Brachionus plicatilis TaxID=10195 RepID=A0A3M7R5K4_BRAPC|nr:defense Hdd11 [Brachionus plicatilis]
MISKTTIFTTFFIFSAFLEALPTGAPLNTCQTMLPRHNAEPIDTDNPPYEIVFSPVNNFTLNVILQSKEQDKSFRGFLMQARREWNGEAIGKWSTSEESTKTIDCFDREDSAVTHDHKQNPISRKVGFKKLTFEWTCPEGMSPNGIILIATIAETSKVIYVNVSKVVHVETPKLESISFDDFGETTEESIRDPVDFEKVVSKAQEENEVREPQMDIERERPVEINEMKNFRNEAVDQQMGRLDNRIQEVESRPISVDRLNEKISHRIMDSQNMLSLEEPILTVNEKPKSIKDDNESFKSQRITHELFNNNDSDERFNEDSQIDDEKKMEKIIENF